MIDAEFLHRVDVILFGPGGAVGFGGAGKFVVEEAVGVGDAAAEEDGWNRGGCRW